MTHTEQGDFVAELLNTIRAEIIRDLWLAKTPETWDGHELRCLVADRCEASAKMSQIRREPKRARAREFRNFCRVAGL